MEHAYSAEMSERSKVISLGTIDANPSTHEGTLTIMEELHKYVPTGDDGKLFPVLVQGDGLSVDRMRTAKQRRCRTPTTTARLEGLVISPQEFHHEALHLQVGIAATKTIYNGRLSELFLWTGHDGHILQGRYNEHAWYLVQHTGAV